MIIFKEYYTFRQNFYDYRSYPTLHTHTNRTKTILVTKVNHTTQLALKFYYYLQVLLN